MTLRLDRTSASMVRAAWAMLARERISDSGAALGYDPHLTLAVLDDTTDATALIEIVHRTTAGWTTATTLHFAALAVFPASPATLWLAPTVTVSLLQRHATLCAALPGAALHPHYRPGAWVPHVTLADDLAATAIGSAFAAALSTFAPFTATCDRLDVVHFRPVTVLWHGALPGSRTAP